ECPGLPMAPVFEHLPPHASTSRRDKLAALREALQAKGASHHWVTTLDDLAWLLNLRGADVDYNPVFLGHALVSLDAVQLFVGEGKVDAALQARLADDGVVVRPYADALPALKALPAGSVLLVDPKRITWGLRQAVPVGVKVVEAINPSTLAKSRKTAAEAAFIREAMARDGAAMCAFYAWLEQALGCEAVSELTIDERLTAEREKQPGYVSLSFPTIAGFNANGALPHYRATPEAFAWLSTPQGLVAEGLLLIDSGAQYLGGTTDITRVWAIGTPTAAQKRDFTLVLKGTMALSRTRFPLGTLAPMLDAIARAPLWAEGLDFGHGTGHGVGYFLNVHEGPQSISKAVPHGDMAMQAGMVTSIEPGLYRPGQWGIRIENLVLNVEVPPTVPDAEPGAPEHGTYLAFETLSLCPIDTRCIDLSLLRDDERAWLNSYHAEVLQRLRPIVSGDALRWLEMRTQPI
ncbi:MAG: aminopeptidase family protein P, partial [Aquabacterium commune]|uniref:aminopeptidase family protein P n=1 Tax=Aquabacterium commune TaxID=70586 RepID=UPI003BB1C5E9